MVKEHVAVYKKDYISRPSARTKERIRHREKMRKKLQDDNFRLEMNIKRFIFSLIQKKKIQKTRAYSQYGIDTKVILEKIGNRPNKEYDLDHIIPCSAFDFSNPDEIKRCFSPDNLQWLPLAINRKKGARWKKDGIIYRGKKVIGYERENSQIKQMA